MAELVQVSDVQAFGVLGRGTRNNPAVLEGDVAEDVEDGLSAPSQGQKRLPWPCHTDVVARLQAHGAELVGEIVQYENIYRLCYVRGPEGIVVGLAEQLS